MSRIMELWQGEACAAAWFGFEQWLLNRSYTVQVKLELAIGKGKKKYDKRETIKNRELKKSFDRILKSF